MTGVGWPGRPLSGSKATHTIPTACDPNRRPLFVDSVVAFGKLSTLDHVRPRSALFQSPSDREPKNRISPAFGSTASRSPLNRPSSLPPILNGTSMLRHVRPRSAELNIAALPLLY